MFYINIIFTDELRSNHKSKMLRKAALSEWLKTVVSVIDEQELNEPNHIDGILSFLSRGEVHEACELAIKNGEYVPPCTGVPFIVEV